MMKKLEQERFEEYLIKEEIGNIEMIQTPLRNISFKNEKEQGQESKTERIKEELSRRGKEHN